MAEVAAFAVPRGSQDGAAAPEVLDIERLAELLDGSGALVATITPAVARHIVDRYNTHNRDPRRGSIKRYESDLVKDRWRLNGATIVFTDRRRLGDGQNRLIACMNTGVPLTTYVVFGVADECFGTIDAGKPRDHADVLKLMGAEHPRYMAVAVRWAEWIAIEKVKGRPAFTPMQTGELYLKHKAVADFIPESRQIARNNNQSVGMVAAFLYTFEKIDGDLAEQFAAHWAQGSYPPRFRAIATMQAELAHLRSLGTKGGHLSQSIRAAMIVNAWNSARRNRGGGIAIKWDPARRFPAIS